MTSDQSNGIKTEPNIVLTWKPEGISQCGTDANTIESLLMHNIQLRINNTHNTNNKLDLFHT